MNEKELRKYKLQKLFKTKLFWGITAGIVLAIIVIVTLPVLSIREINRQTEELTQQVENDLNNPELMPYAEGVSAPDTIDEFYDMISPKDPTYNDLSDFKTNKEDNLNLGFNLSVSGLTSEAYKLIASGDIWKITDALQILSKLRNDNFAYNFSRVKFDGSTWNGILPGAEQSKKGTLDSKYVNLNDNTVHTGDNLLDGVIINLGSASINLGTFVYFGEAASRTSKEIFGERQDLFKGYILEVKSPTSLAFPFKISYMQYNPIIDDSGSSINWWEETSVTDGTNTLTVIPPVYNPISTKDFSNFLFFKLPGNLLGIDDVTLLTGTDINPDEFLRMILDLEVLLHIGYNNLVGLNFDWMSNILMYSNFAKEDDGETFVHSNTYYVVKQYLNKAYSTYSSMFDGKNLQKMTLNTDTGKYEFSSILIPTERNAFFARVFFETDWETEFNELNSNNRFLNWVQTEESALGATEVIPWNTSNPNELFAAFYYLVNNYYLLWDGIFNDTKDQIVQMAIADIKLSDIPYPFK